MRSLLDCLKEVKETWQGKLGQQLGCIWVAAPELEWERSGFRSELQTGLGRDRELLDEDGGVGNSGRGGARKPELVPGVADFICTHVVTRVVL